LLLLQRLHVLRDEPSLLGLRLRHHLLHALRPTARDERGQQRQLQQQP
jgi:hypothetical protein